MLDLAFDVISVLFTLQGNKILALSKLKAFADKKLNVTQNIEFVFYREKAFFPQRH